MRCGIGPVGAKEDDWGIMSIVGAVDSIDVQPLRVIWITVYTDLIEATTRPLDSKVVESDDGWSVNGEVSIRVIG